MNNQRTIVRHVFTLFLALVVGAASAADVLKYGATFEPEANGVSNDFAYVVGDYVAEADYHGVADGESYGWFVWHCYNGVDYSDSADESMIIARSDAAGGQALQLNTDAGMLTNKLQKSVADEITTAIADGGCAYIETDIKFVPQDFLDVEIMGGIGGYRSAKSVLKARIGGYDYVWPPSFFVPSCSTSPLFAIYAFKDEDFGYNYYYHCTTNLVVYHCVMDAKGGITYTNEVFPSVTIEESHYTKLRIEMKQLEDPMHPGAKYNAFSVRVDDGAPLSSVTALDARFGGTATGTWFMTIEDRSRNAGQILSSLNFKHCGEIDNIKVGLIEDAQPLPRDPDGNAITNGNVLAWIAHYGAGQSNLNALTMAQFNEDFLLNLDPTKTCRAELRITSFQVEDDTVSLGLQLTRTENGTAVGTRAINGRVKLLGGASLSDGSFSVLDADVGNDDFGDGNTAGLEYELPDSTPPAFFKVIVE